MGNHRAERGPRRAASADNARKPFSTRTPTGGARRAAAPTDRVSHISETDAPVAIEPKTLIENYLTATAAVDVAVPTRLPSAASVERSAAPSAGKSAPSAGRRRATAHTGSRGPLFKGLPSVPVIAGAAALAISIGGAVLAPGFDNQGVPSSDVAASNALSSAAASALADRDVAVSRDSRREARAEESEAKLVARAEAAAAARSQKLAALHVQANRQAAKIEANQWVMPVSGYRLSATFGLSSYLWSTVHTGLDFAAPSGTPLLAVANGTITEVGSDGSYGYKTVLTLEDGTEIWYCHQSTMNVSVGQTVVGGDVIGTVGSTGNSTGPHLHLEVRPGGGSPVDPYSTLLAHGLQP